MFFARQDENGLKCFEIRLPQLSPTSWYPSGAVAFMLKVNIPTVSCECNPSVQMQGLQEVPQGITEVLLGCGRYKELACYWESPACSRALGVLQPGSGNTPGSSLLCFCESLWSCLGGLHWKRGLEERARFPSEPAGKTCMQHRQCDSRPLCTCLATGRCFGETKEQKCSYLVLLTLVKRRKA